MQWLYLVVKDNFSEEMNFVAVNLISKAFFGDEFECFQNIVLVTLTANNIHPQGRVVVPGLDMEPQKPEDYHVEWWRPVSQWYLK